ncbi:MULTISPECIES: arginine deiminase family protein [unclassified Enterococcus]|uniref:dimethylarginine dimethylaminohydrolase family protein n=1 Tax=unclassified Enterococcus TaxID=2608891 RepID=UPI001552C12B|nr:MULTISPECIES: arginine deiminase family protein [unclassified Enterococcus]MBS7577139.1 nitrate reductase [Enterococcus sp. MMGLQ5-2]MBS7584414.1 nitrate reductase [Enterococcus sp. MMGLQ5-1]NPD12269.1 nitrate reductase [Enterococcus sp. MMGLQ5-1]NPD36973.1 nitrate reductase [Enterococcus sp. MMGLQ5-2]
MFVINGTSKLTKVLLSPPEYLISPTPINEISKIYAGQPLDRDKMQKEYQNLVEAYRAAGVEVIEAKGNEATTNAVFARDFGGCIKEGYILGRFKKSIREQEREMYAAKMQALGVPKVAEVKNGYFEGGDFAFLDEKTIAIGQIDRTNATGINEIREQLTPLGYDVHAVPANPDYLHLDMCFNLVAPKIAIAYLEGLPQSFIALLKEKKIDVITGSEALIYKHGYNVQAIGDNRVLSLAQNSEMNLKMREKGLTVIEVEITELLKAGGGIHCMTFPLKRVAELEAEVTAG